MDHLIPNGGNGLYNKVLACSICNGDEKREQDWQEFLKEKCSGDPSIFNDRYQRIVTWHQHFIPAKNEDNLQKLVTDQLEKLKIEIDCAVTLIRTERDKKD